MNDRVERDQLTSAVGGRGSDISQRVGTLDYVDTGGNEKIRCCITSICDQDFSPAIDCLTGIIGESIVPPG